MQPCWACTCACMHECMRAYARHTCEQRELGVASRGCKQRLTSCWQQPSQDAGTSVRVIC
eukprot:356915-Chlamydomonas_euryale.AAC.1